MKNQKFLEEEFEVIKAVYAAQNVDDLAKVILHASVTRVLRDNEFFAVTTLMNAETHHTFGQKKLGIMSMLKCFWEGGN